MRDAVAERQVEGFRERLVKFIADPKGQAESLREEVKAVCWARGRQVEAHFTDGTTLTGEAIGLNEDASLILRTFRAPGDFDLDAYLANDLESAIADVGVL